MQVENPNKFNRLTSLGVQTLPLGCSLTNSFTEVQRQEHTQLQNHGAALQNGVRVGEACLSQGDLLN